MRHAWRDGFGSFRRVNRAARVVLDKEHVARVAEWQTQWV